MHVSQFGNNTLFNKLQLNSMKSFTMGLSHQNVKADDVLDSNLFGAPKLSHTTDD